VGATRGQELVRVLVPLGIGLAAVAGVYAFGTQHTPDYGTSLFGQIGPDTLPLKSWLATALLALAAVQLTLALRIYGRLPTSAPGGRPVTTTHRTIGVVAILLTLPIAYNCALALVHERTLVLQRLQPAGALIPRGAQPWREAARQVSR
jgi:hypothetical protein